MKMHGAGTRSSAVSVHVGAQSARQ